MHKYNNQDHSMLAAMLAVDNLYGASHDLWSLNSDMDYQEEVRVQHRAAAAPSFAFAGTNGNGTA